MRASKNKASVEAAEAGELDSRRILAGDRHGLGACGSRNSRIGLIVIELESQRILDRENWQCRGIEKQTWRFRS